MLAQETDGVGVRKRYATPGSGGADSGVVRDSPTAAKASPPLPERLGDGSIVLDTPQPWAGLDLDVVDVGFACVFIRSTELLFSLFSASINHMVS